MLRTHLKTLDAVLLLVIITLCVLTRLPQLTSPYFHVDDTGDECVLGLMANHMLLGKDFSFYFWGQSYGFSWIESGAIAIAIKFFGYNTYTIKVPMLVLWTFGCLFFYGAIARWTSRWCGFLSTCLLVFSPAWMDWSLKARAGYVTAFLLFSMLLFVLARHQGALNHKKYLLIGVLCGFIYFSQPMYLLGVFPLLLYFLIKDSGIKKIYGLLAGVAVIFILARIMLVLQGNSDIWAPNLFKPNYPLNRILEFYKDSLFNAFNQDSGDYPASIIVSNAWCFFVLAGTCGFIYKLIFKKKMDFSSVLFLSVLLVLAATFFIDNKPRYTLSLSVLVIFWFGLLSYEYFNKNIFTKFLICIFFLNAVILGSFVSINYKDFYRNKSRSVNEIPDSRYISQMIGFLNANGVKYVFSLDCNLSYKIIFFSGEKIISRWMGLKERQPLFAKAVTDAFLKSEKVALVGNSLDQFLAYMIAFSVHPPDFTAGPYFACLNPDIGLISNDLKFQLIE